MYYSALNLLLLIAFDTLLRICYAYISATKVNINIFLWGHLKRKVSVNI